MRVSSGFSHASLCVSLANSLFNIKLRNVCGLSRLSGPATRWQKNKKRKGGEGGGLWRVRISLTTDGRNGRASLWGRNSLTMIPDRFSNHPLPEKLNLNQGHEGCWSLSQQSEGERQRNTWTDRQLVFGPHMQTWGNLAFPIHLACFSLDYMSKPENLG